MRSAIAYLPLFVSALLLAKPGLPQIVTGESASVANGVRSSTIHVSARPFASSPVVGQPYSAERTRESVQTLADGTHINQHSAIEKLFRDSEGRERTERASMPMPMAHDPGVTFVEITDPVAGYRYLLDDQNKIAHRSQIEVRQPQAGAMPRAVAVLDSVPPEMTGAMTSLLPAPRADVSRPAMTHEDLGTQTIEGVLCHGRKTTTTFPIGFQGNDRPMVATNETWMAEDLKVLVLSKHSDPRMGETTIRLTNISRSEPDPLLFQPPAGYKVVDENGAFTIETTRPVQR